MTTTTIPTRDEGDLVLRHAAVTAGACLLLMAALGPLLLFVEGLARPEEPSRAALEVLASEGLFRLGVAGFVVTCALDVVIAGALYRVFRPANEGLSLLAAWFRLAYSVVLVIATGHLLVVLDLLRGDADGAARGAGDLNAQVLVRMDSFVHTWHTGLILFGVHLVLVGILAHRSGYVPRLLGLLVVLAGVGYAVGNLAPVLPPGPWATIQTFTWIGELLLAIWLVTRGRRLTTHSSRSA